VKRWAFGPLLAPLLLAGVVGGCAIDSSSSEGVPLREVRVVARPMLSMAPLWIALEEGYFEDEGLVLSLTSLASSRDAMPALLRGELDVLAASITPSFLNAIAQGATVRMVAGKGSFAAQRCTYNGLYVSADRLMNGELLPPPGRERWVVSHGRGTYFEYVAKRALAAKGIPRDRIERRSLDGVSELHGLIAGTLDIAVGNESEYFPAIEAGVVAKWVGTEEVLPDHQFSVLLYGPSFLERDPEAGQRFMNAYLRGVRQFAEGKTERNIEILSRTSEWDPETLEALCWLWIEPDGSVDVDSIVAMQEYALARGYLNRPVAPEEFWEPEFIERAARELASQ
jgi:NitT/TauT family transport system substrate-binding protein